MRDHERLIWKKSNVMYIKLSDTLIIHKTPSKFAPCELKLRLTLYFCAQVIYKVVLENSPHLHFIW